MPKKETLEFLATQAVADFLAAENSPTVDGIIFPSAQVAGNALNFMLFQKPSRVEEIPPKSDENKEREKIGAFQIENLDFEWDGQEDDIRSITLKIDLETVCVHHVEAVQFTTGKYSVRRHRFEKGETDF